MRMIHSFVIVLGVLVTGSLLTSSLEPAPVSADDSGKLKAKPFVFVGKASECGGVAGSNIVTAAWLRGMGLPDNGSQNGSPTPSDQRDPHFGLLLSKNGPTPDCSSAGAEITGVKGLVVDATFTVGYDYRDGGHCGAGAPRFNIDTDDGFFFVGCALSTQSPASQDPAQWTQSRSVLATGGPEFFPGPIPVGSKIKSITILFDEGTDTANNDTQGIGLAVLDNIFINGKFIRSGSGIQPSGNGDDDDD